MSGHGTLEILLRTVSSERTWMPCFGVTVAVVGRIDAKFMPVAHPMTRASVQRGIATANEAFQRQHPKMASPTAKPGAIVNKST